MTIFAVKPELTAPAWRYISGTVKGSDGNLPGGYELPDSNEFVSQNGKDYVVIRDRLPFEWWVKEAYAIELSKLEEVVEGEPPQPPTETTLPEIPYSIVLGDGVNYQKETVTGILKPLK